MATEVGSGGEIGSSRRLGSWKEIAAYFGKDIRTVRRWEVERGLPVHRVRGGERGSVFAYISELEDWLCERDTGSSGSIEAATSPAQIPELPETAAEKDFGHEVVGEAAAGPETALPPATGHRLGWTLGLLGMAAVVLGGVVLRLHARARLVSRPVANAARQRPGNTPDQVTLDLYLRGRYLWNLRTEASLTQAVDLFTQAIVHDPNYSPAYAGLADSYLLLRQYGHMTDAEAYPRAYFASRRAVALDDSSAEAHLSYAFVLDHWMWNFPAAEAEYRRAIALDPRDAESHSWYATSLLSAGRSGDALHEIEIARQLQPESVSILVNRGLILGQMDLPAGIAALSELEPMNPRVAPLHTYLGNFRLAAKQYREFLSEERMAAELRGDVSEVRVLDNAREELTRGGEPAMMRSLAEGYGALAEHPHDPHAMEAAEYFARMRDSDRTLHFLTLSLARRESNLQPARYQKDFAFLHGDPRFEALVQRMQTPYRSVQGSSVQ